MTKRNPDVTRTREEHARNITARAGDYMRKGATPDDAIRKAGEDWRQYLKGEAQRQIDQAIKALGGPKR